MKIALGYLYEGKYTLAETSARAALERGNQEAQALATGVLGDIEVARGRLDRAAARQLLIRGNVRKPGQASHTRA